MQDLRQEGTTVRLLQIVPGCLFCSAPLRGKELVMIPQAWGVWMSLGFCMHREVAFDLEPSLLCSEGSETEGGREEGRMRWVEGGLGDGHQDSPVGPSGFSTGWTRDPMASV